MTVLRVEYGDTKLEKLCTDEREMQRRRGDIASRLKLRIKALEAADRVADLSTNDPLGNWHQLSANLRGLWSGKLSANERILVRPDGDDVPWDATAVTVMAIDDYH